MVSAGVLEEEEGGREERVDGSMGPRIWEGLRVSSSVPGGWIGSYSEVASRPASFRIILEPPGWESRNSGGAQWD